MFPFLISEEDIVVENIEETVFDDTGKDNQNRYLFVVKKF